VTKRSLSVLLGLAFGFTMAASFIGGNLESKIIRSRQFVPSVNEFNRIEIKGNIYFVSDDTYRLSKGSKYAFVAGIIVMIVLIAAAKTAKQ
jgi:hypothetical protein